MQTMPFQVRQDLLEASHSMKSEVSSWFFETEGLAVLPNVLVLSISLEKLLCLEKMHC